MNEKLDIEKEIKELQEKYAYWFELFRRSSDPVEKQQAKNRYKEYITKVIDLQNKYDLRIPPSNSSSFRSKMALDRKQEKLVISAEQDYSTDLENRFMSYWNAKKKAGEFTDNLLDNRYGSGRLPVFRAEYADRNILTRPQASNEEKKQLLNLIPEGKRHKWFRSMNSSQALSLSFFGNFIIYGQMDWLRNLMDDDGQSVFGPAELSANNFSMEHEIGIMNEPRPTSLDAFISGPYQIAIECKLTETDIGNCSRPRLKTDSQEYCSGSYSIQNNRINRCVLAEIGIRYWDYVPLLFKWSADIDHDPCPLKGNYQLVRNVLAACVREDGTISSGNGHAVLVYDRRNPSFADGGKGADAFYSTRDALTDAHNLRKISWQSICSFMKRNNLLNWLTNSIRAKYGIE
jgi:hypothetical protein